MADAFRGLTIRLGADARPLNAAISSITRSAGQAQKQLNAMSKALKINPANSDAMASKLALIQDRADLTARAAQRIRTAMSQASAETKALAESNKSVYAATEKLRSEYNNLDAQLQHVYDSMAKMVLRADSLKKNDDVIAGIAARLKKISHNDAIAYVQKLRAEAKGTGEVAKKATQELNYLLDNVKESDAVDHIHRLKEAVKGSGAEADEARAKLKGYLEQASRRTGINSLFGQDKGDADALAATLVSLRARLKEVSAAYEDAKHAEGFRAMKTQLIAYEAELRQAAGEAARLKTELLGLGSTGDLPKLVSEMQRINAATDEVVANAHRMNDAYKAAPRSMATFLARTNEVKAAQHMVESEIKSIRAAIKAIENEPAFDSLAAGSAEAYAQALRVEQAYENIDVQLRQSREAYRSLVDAMKEMKSSGVDRKSEEFTKLRDAIRESWREVRRHKNALDALEDDHATAALTVEMRKLTSAEAQAVAKAEQLHQATSKLNIAKNIGAGMRELGYGLYSTVTPAIMMAGRYAIQSANDIDAAYRDMRKTVNGTEEEFEALRQAALDFSSTHVTSADTILEIEAMGGQLGIQVENLEAFATTVANLDIATNMSSDDIAESLGKMASVMNISADEYDNFGDSLVRLGNNMPVMESDIMTLTTRYMGMGKVVGMTADQMLGWSAAASATGQKSEAAGSSMQRFISNMETAVVGGGEMLEKFASIAGMSADEFATAFQEDASKAMYKFIEGLGEMQKGGQSVNQALKDLKINNVRDKQLLEGLANQMANGTKESNILKNALDMSRDAYNGLATDMGNGKIEEAGDAAREAGRKMEGFSGQLQLMKNNAQILAAEMAEGATPVLKFLGEMFQDIATQVRSLPNEAKTGIVVFLGAAAAIGPVFVAAGTTLRAFASIIQGVGTAVVVAGNYLRMLGSWAGNALTSIASGSSRAAGAANALKNAFQGLSKAGVAAIFIAIASAVAMAASAFSEAVEHGRKLTAATKGFADAIRDTTPRIQEGSNDLAKLGEATREVTTDYDDLLDKQAELRKSIEERNNAAQSEIGLLQDARSAIDAYAGKTNLSAEQMARLRAAVEIVNQKLGTHYQVLSNTNGILSDENGNRMLGEAGAADQAKASIDQLIESKQREIRLNAISSSYEDTYKQHVDNLRAVAEAQQKVAEYSERTKANPIDPEANFQLTQWNQKLDEATAMTAETDDALQFLSDSMAALTGKTEEASNSFASLVNGSAEWRAAFTGQDFDNLVRGFEEAGIAADSFYDLSSADIIAAAKAYRESGGSIESVLKALGLQAVSLSDQLARAFENDEAFAAFKENASSLGIDLDTLIQKATESGITVQEMAAMGVDGFNNLLAYANYDLSQIGVALGNLNALGIDPKYLQITDEGMVNTLTGQVWMLDQAANTVTDGERTFSINEDGSLTEITAEVQAMDGQTVNATATMTDNFDEAAANADEAAGAIDAIPDDATTEFDSSDIVEAGEDADTTTQKINGIPSQKDVSVNVGGNAISALSTIKSLLAGINSKDIYVTTHETTVKNAAGGISPAVLRAIPRNAAGGAMNGIVTRATLTNRGWVGEAGDEALLHMRNAGGAIIPLSNRRHVRPFARAVASEMPSGRFDDSAIVAELQALHRDMARMRVELDGRQVGKAVTPQVSRNLGWEKAASERGF